MDDPNSPSTPLDAIAGVVPPETRDRAITDAGAAVEKARDTLDAVKQETTEQLAALQDKAQDQLAEATDKAKSFATRQKDVAGDQLGGIASAISKVADDLEGDQAVAAGYARELAGGLKSVSESVRSRNVDELVAIAEDFGKQQPLAFLGAAALAGFVASRFILASAQRRGTNAPASGAPPSSSATRPAANTGEF